MDGFSRKDFLAGHSLVLLIACLVILGFPLAPPADAASPLIHNSTYGGTGKYGTWGQSYTCATCHSKGSSPNIKKVSMQIATPTGLRKVTFTRYTAVSNATVSILGNDRRTVNVNNSTNVCEVCHHRTEYHQYSASKIAAKVGGLDHTQHKSNKKDCTKCHAHNVAFKRPEQDQCISCHGEPPVTVGQLYTNALGDTPPNAGAHDKHRNTLKFECQTCHNNYGHGLMGNDFIEIGFRIVSTNWKPFVGEVTTGTFTGTIGSGFNSEYLVAPNNPQTILNRVPGVTSCNIYCHGDNWNVHSGRVGTGVSWTQGSLGACSNAICHGTSQQHPPTPVLLGNISTGAHKTHVGKMNTACTICHEDLPDAHMVNGRVNVTMTLANMSTSSSGISAKYNGFTLYSTQTLAASGSYFSCSSTYCHSNVQGTNGTGQPTSFKTAQWGGARLACDGCHGGLRTNAAPIASGAHTKHIATSAYRYACNVCHEGSGSDNNTKHGNKKIDVTMGTSFGGTYTQVNNMPGDGFGSCSNVNCHYGKSVAWSDPALNCSACHGGTAVNLTSGKHSAHISTTANTSLGTAYGCVACHAQVVSNDTTVTNYLRHANGFSDYSGVRAGKSYTAATGVCTNVYCHTDGKGRQNVAFTVSNGWNSSVTYANCTGCHGNDTTFGFYTSVVGEPNYQNAGMTQPRANSHQRHMGGTTLIVCVYCHNQTMNATGDIIPGSTTHTNGSIEVQAGGGKNFSYVPSTRTCSTITCHGTGSRPVRWGEVFPADCTGCHGNNAVSFRPISSGKHTAHINNKGILGKNFNCAACHALTAAPNDRAIVDTSVHGNGFKNVTGVMSGGRNTYTIATGVCSATYCHTDGKGQRNVTFTSLNGWKSTATFDCKGCHGNNSPADFTSSSAGEPNYASAGAGTVRANDHKNHVDFGAATCINCHNNTVDAAGALKQDVTLHLNQSIDVVAGNGKSFGYDKPNKTCSNISCHGGVGSYSQIWGTPVKADCTGCHGNNVASSNPIASGKHAAHIKNRDLGVNYNCTACHAKTINADERSFANRALHGNGFVEYSGVKAGGSASYSTVTGACSATYCHTDGKGRQNAAFNLANGWKSSVTYSGCKGCHGNDATLGHYSSVAGEPNYQNAGTALPRANSHLKHSKAGAATCYACHSDTTVSGFAIISGSTRHTDGVIDVKAGGTASFTGWTNSAKTCSNINCHFNKNAVWGETLGCNACHGNDATTLTTKKHSGHISTTANPSLGTALGCVECHAKTVSDNSTISGPAQHANGFVDYSGVRAGGVYDSVAGACNNNYCHTDGKGQRNVTFSLANGWNSSVVYSDCKQCHGNDSQSGSITSLAGEPNYANAGAGVLRANSHNSHVNAYGNGNACDICHTNTVNLTGTAAKAGGSHLNGSINVTFNLSRAGSGSSYDYGQRTCSNTLCHSGSTPQWGDPLSGGCKACHANLITKPGFHAIHINDLVTSGMVTFYAYTANKSSGSNYRIGCANCHPTDVAHHRDGHVDVTINKNKSGGSYINSLNNATADGINQAGSGVVGTAGSSVSCELAYCHSAGKSTTVAQNTFTPTPSWYGASRAANRCGVCHGNPPQYAGQSHYVNPSTMGINGTAPYKDSGHMVGIHFKNIYKGNGGYGFLGYSSAGDKAHGNAGVSTTMSCDICHSGIVDPAKPDTYAMFGTGKKFECAQCHTASTPTKLQAGDIIDTGMHVNGKKDVLFTAVPYRTKAQLSNVANAGGVWMRNGGYKAAGSYDSTDLSGSTWDAQTKTCLTACHVNQPAIIWGQPLKCSSCHANQ